MDGELAGESSSAGNQSLLFWVPDAAAEVRVVFTPDGDEESESYAVLKGFASRRGFVFGIR